MEFRPIEVSEQQQRAMAVLAEMHERVMQQAIAACGIPAELMGGSRLVSEMPRHHGKKGE